MKIYNEVTSIFNEITGLWETITEDSYEYSGPVAYAQGVPPNSTPINSADTIADTIKTTAGYFTHGDGTITGEEIYTASSNASSKAYYFNVTQVDDTGAQALSAETQFSVTYGHFAGSGSDTYGDSTISNTTLVGETKEIYQQLALRFLHPTEATGGFFISASGKVLTANPTGSRDNYIYALFGKRARFKDRMNKKAWTLALSGSGVAGNAKQVISPLSYIELTDDSLINPATATPAGPRYNIVSGALGKVHTNYNDDTTAGTTGKCYGWFYPEMGAMIFSGKQLAETIPGLTGSGTNNGIDHNPSVTGSGNLLDVGLFAQGGGVGTSAATMSGFTPNDSNTYNAYNALKLLQCMTNMKKTTTFRLRSEEDKTEEIISVELELMSITLVQIQHL